MSDLRQAAQQALEALETNNKAWKHLADSGDAGFWEAEEQPFYEISVKAITALRAALAEPESDYERGFVDGMQEQMKRSVDKAVNRMAQTTHWEGAPTPRKPLTDDEIAQAMFRADAIVTGPMQFRFAREIERAHGIVEQKEKEWK